MLTKKKQTPQNIIDQKIKPVLELLRSFSIEEKNSHASVSQEDFENGVKEFLKKHKTTIKAIFSEQDARYPWLKEGFLMHPLVQGYLARDNLELLGHSDVPAYSELEKEIFLAADQISVSPDPKVKEIHRIPFRTDKESLFCKQTSTLCYEQFYSSGTSYHVTLERVVELKNKIAAESPIYILLFEDFYKAMEAIERMSKRPSLRSNNQGMTFIISPVIKDAHIMMVLSVINTKEQQVVYHVLINSEESNDYFQYLEKKVNATYNRNYLEGFSAVPPLFDASFHLQLNADDRNCALYTLAFCEALILALEKSSELQQALSSAALQRDVSAPPSWSLLQKTIKQFCPLLFVADKDEGYLPRSYESRKKDFLTMRWQAGNKVLRDNAESTRVKLQTRIRQSEDLLGAIAQRVRYASKPTTQRDPFFANSAGRSLIDRSSTSSVTELRKRFDKK